MTEKRTSDWVPFGGETALLDKIYSLILSDFDPEMLALLRTEAINIERFNSSWFAGLRPDEEYDGLSYEALADFVNGIPVSAFGVDEAGKKICGLKTLYQASRSGNHGMETTKPYVVMIYPLT